MTTYQTSKLAQSIKSSDVRNLLQFALLPDMVSLAGGLPAPELFDVEGLKTAAALALGESATASLQYGLTDGQPRLKTALIRHLADKGVCASNETLVVTSGSQQALDLMGRTLIDQGDTVIVERPTYLAALQAFSQYGPEYVSIPMDAEGGCVETLEQLDWSKRPKLVYCVTNFANPSGASMALSRRQWLAKWAARNKVFVLEDDPYGDLYTSGSPIPPLAALAKDIPGASEWCGYTSTLSKCIAPGLRVGWLVLPPALANTVSKIKQAVDLHTSSLAQEVAARYLESGRLPGRLVRVRAEYAARRDVLETALRTRFGPRLVFNSTDGGMFLWARFTDGTNTRALLQHALERKVVFVPGDIFYASDADFSTLRLNFTGATVERLRLGVDRLFEAHADYKRNAEAAQLLPAAVGID